MPLSIATFARQAQVIGGDAQPVAEAVMPCLARISIWCAWQVSVIRRFVLLEACQFAAIRRVVAGEERRGMRVGAGVRVSTGAGITTTV